MSIVHADSPTNLDVFRCNIAVEAVLLDKKDMVFFVLSGSGEHHALSPESQGGAECVLIGRVSALDLHERSCGIKRGDRVALYRTGVGITPDEWLGAEIATAAADLHPLPSQWSLDKAVSAVSLAFALRALRLGRFATGDSCAVVGLSPAGLFAVQLLRELGAMTVVAVDSDPAKRDLALTFGATGVEVPEIFATPASSYTVSAFDKVFFMATGSDLLASAIRGVGHLGIVVAAGTITENDFTISDYYRQIIIKESTIVGVARAEPEDWLAAVAKLDQSNLLMQKPLTTMSAAEMRDGRLRELAASGYVFGPIRVEFD